MPHPTGSVEQLRNIAIIAHVDHGKTTLVDQLLRQSGTLKNEAEPATRIMDSNDLEKERGITILAKNTAIEWNNYRINIVDTPGHADFGGEVERILSMVDSVLLLVDAVEGPMPQTRFVTQKAFSWGLKPIVVINKIDREGARPDWVIDQVFDLFVSLDASDEQLDFPVIYASAIQGCAHTDYELVQTSDMTPLFETLVNTVPPPQVNSDGPLQMQISSLDYSSYVGAIGIGRITRGTLKRNMPVTVINRQGDTRSEKIAQVLGFMGLDRVECDSAQAGDIIAITGIKSPRISDTICHPEHIDPLPALSVDEPTVSMTFHVNNSPFAGLEGQYVTSRQIKDRLERELIANVALRVADTGNGDAFVVSGRGELHLSILIETMRREGYELAVSRPEVVTQWIEGQEQEPYEQLVVDVESEHQGALMEYLSVRRAELKQLQVLGGNRLSLEFIVPTRGLIGFHGQFQTMTSGTGVAHHNFSHYGPLTKQTVGARARGALIANAKGKATAYALWNLQERGEMLIKPQTAIYEGMIIGIHTRNNDLVVNANREKQLTNIRAAGSDENIMLTPIRNMTLEFAMAFINDDELLEITPASMRLRKKVLIESERRRHRKSDG